MRHIKILGNALINEASLLFTVNSDNLPITGNHNNSDERTPSFDELRAGYGDDMDIPTLDELKNM